MPEPVLRVRGLRHGYGRQEVLRGIDLEVYAGEVVALMGPSGSGKSTLLHLMAGLLRPDAGEIELLGRRIDHLAERERSRLRLRHLGFVFQFGDLVPELTVVENVELPLRLLGTQRAQARRHATELLDLLGVADLADRRLHEVSGGQSQRAAVARALVHSPAAVLADEPTGALDTVAGEVVLEALVRAAGQTGAAVVLVTHELTVASWAARDVQLRDGVISDPRATTSAAAGQHA